MANVSFLDAIKNATADDLAAIDAEIAFLNQARNLLIEKFPKPKNPDEPMGGGSDLPAAKKKPGPKPKGDGKPKGKAADFSDLPTDAAELVGLFLKQNGPKRRDAIRNACGITENDLLDHILSGEWFEKDGPLWTLSSDGHAKFRRDD